MAATLRIRQTANKCTEISILLLKGKTSFTPQIKKKRFFKRLRGWNFERTAPVSRTGVTETYTSVSSARLVCKRLSIARRVVTFARVKERVNLIKKLKLASVHIPEKKRK
ncbi:hypothetical protein NDU88_004717 [Pleurodeles waltl]|uniref:60S ribosomal protein L28 n=1 Tax=Pleurodeles waltl TaxID=8319 RepID=A0AAV7VJK4_PLEWA|nr:hypothetical protein NDU88_004717 [Pleurodeles waltl]